MKAALETTAAQPSALLYESYAEIETAEGVAAWNAGNYHRAVKLWLSAARWAQFAVKAANGGASL